MLGNRKNRVMKLVFEEKKTWEQAATDFLLAKKAEGSAPRMIKDYNYHLISVRLRK
ncbi:hypothetical protein [Heliorestis acidaminivorans]|uniref:hypothetical protein n=1 Tax=Heliorestis acidaminivorans TaxID=553427 RepID=UPI001478A241|nr:hypothetical protein [Heliorestis acidaminivorans]